MTPPRLSSIPTTPRRKWHGKFDRWQFRTCDYLRSSRQRPQWSAMGWTWAVATVSPNGLGIADPVLQAASLSRIAPPAKAVTTPRKAKIAKSVKRKGRGE